MLAPDSSNHAPVSDPSASMILCRAAAELKLERASRGQVEGMAADLRGQLEGIYAAKEAARSAAQHTLAILEKEESALNAMKVHSAHPPLLMILEKEESALSALKVHLGGPPLPAPQ
jgi:hypothetical protein